MSIDVESFESFEAQFSDSMYASTAQKYFTYAGYYANSFARAMGRNIERLTRPMPNHRDIYWKEVAERVKEAAYALFSCFCAVAFFTPALICYTLAACLGQGHFELIEPSSKQGPWQKRAVKLLSLNTSFQDPWSPLTAGVESPFAPVDPYPSRISAIVDAIAKQDPLLFLGQECDNLGAQDEFIRLMKERGFCYFLRDLGANDPFRNSSGLFVASKVPLENIAFIPYPSEDKVGLSKWSNQGALTFTIQVQEQSMRFINVHLNYPGGPEHQEARNRQLTRHVIPLIKKGNALVLGDLNFDTSAADKTAAGLEGLANALEGRVTCTDRAKHSLRGKSMYPEGRPCEECAERIDGLIYDPKQIQILSSTTTPLTVSSQLLSDHYATEATVQIVR